MKSLLPRITDAHRVIFSRLSVCPLLGPGITTCDRPILEKIVPKWDERTMIFRFKGVLHSFLNSQPHILLYRQTFQEEEHKGNSPLE